MMTKRTCIWCGKIYDGDTDDYRFCDDCAGKICAAISIVREQTGKYVDLFEELERKEAEP